jgi:hypothetical protein
MATNQLSRKSQLHGDTLLNTLIFYIGEGLCFHCGNNRSVFRGYRSNGLGSFPAMQFTGNSLDQNYVTLSNRKPCVWQWTHLGMCGIRLSEGISKYQQLKKKSAATALNTVLASAHIQMT